MYVERAKAQRREPSKDALKEAAAWWLPRLNLLEGHPGVFVNPGEAQPKGWAGSPQSKLEPKGLVLKPGREKGGFSFSLPPAHGEEGLWHREGGFGAPELGFISACLGETSL